MRKVTLLQLRRTYVGTLNNRMALISVLPLDIREIPARVVGPVAGLGRQTMREAPVRTRQSQRAAITTRLCNTHLPHVTSTDAYRRP